MQFLLLSTTLILLLPERGTTVMAGVVDLHRYVYMDIRVLVIWIYAEKRL